MNTERTPVSAWWTKNDTTAALMLMAVALLFAYGIIHLNRGLNAVDAPRASSASDYMIVYQVNSVDTFSVGNALVRSPKITKDDLAALQTRILGDDKSKSVVIMNVLKLDQ